MFEKRRPFRSRVLRQSARGADCMFRVPDVCTNRNVVLAHSNYAEDGKAMGQKADDFLAALACESCHRWFDESVTAGVSYKRDMFHRALKRTLRWWFDNNLIEVKG